MRIMYARPYRSGPQLEETYTITTRVVRDGIRVYEHHRADEHMIDKQSSKFPGPSEASRYTDSLGAMLTARGWTHVKAT